MWMHMWSPVLLKTLSGRDVTLANSSTTLKVCFPLQEADWNADHRAGHKDHEQDQDLDALL